MLFRKSRAQCSSGFSARGQRKPTFAGCCRRSVKSTRAAAGSASRRLGGRYYEFRTETIPPGDSELQVMTYDEEQKLYRQWVFSSDGYHHEATGTWNPATSTLRWTGKSGDNTFVIDDRFVGPGKLAWTLTRTNPKGQLVQTITGVLRLVEKHEEN